jgi:ABC-type transport system involved in cytochrome c biogenesis permease subunit
MDPQITNLVPVLKSVWLVIHVAVITSSYGFLGVGSIMAFINLLLMGAQTRTNMSRISSSIAQLSRIIEISLIIGLYLLTMGTFLGGVWANVSWGRYWGWDSKETWALITIIIYAFVLHMHLIPKMNGKVLLNSCALLAYASVLMTYFGVNYYLTGMHSYASGDPAPVPPAVYYTIGILAVVITWAGINTKRLKKTKN